MGQLLGGEGKMKRQDIKTKAFKGIIYIILIIGSLLMLLPFLWMISSSLKLESEVFKYPIQWIPSNPQWENYLIVFKKIPLLTYFKNSSFITIMVMTIQLFTSSLAAYAFSKLYFKERDFIFIIYLSTMMVPQQVVMIPQYIIMRNLGLINSQASLILLNAFMPFGVFMLRQFYLSIPQELSEAARIDGCSELMIYSRIIMPLSKPALSSLAIFSFVWSWNDFLYPLIYLSSDSKKTIQVGIRAFLAVNTQDYALLMTAATLSLLPVLILYCGAQKFIIKGIATTGLKG
jgi:multiple sugar transport system permease protein